MQWIITFVAHLLLAQLQIGFSLKGFHENQSINTNINQEPHVASPSLFQPCQRTTFYQMPYGCNGHGHASIRPCPSGGKRVLSSLRGGKRIRARRKNARPSTRPSKNSTAPTKKVCQRRLKLAGPSKEDKREDNITNQSAGVNASHSEKMEVHPNKISRNLDELCRVHGRSKRGKLDIEKWLQKPGAYLDSWEAYQKGSRNDTFGEKAWKALRGKTGRAFKQAKKKFKRSGIVMGGKISTEVRSIKFTDDDFK